MSRPEDGPTSTRDPRLDFFRGLALLFIFIDHTPGNSLAHWTLRSFGVSDAAEVFVLIAGFAAFTAYSGTFQRQGWMAGCRRVFNRVRDLFAAHLILVAVGAGLLAVAARYFENPLYFEHVNLTPFSFDPLEAIWRTIILQYQPGYFNILPLYIVLLAWFPVLVWMLQRNAEAALGLSFALWVGARYGLSLPSWPETIGWFFNPFAWQFLFAIGAYAALRARQGAALPRARWLLVLALAYVAFNFILAAPWIEIPGLDLPRLIPIDWIPTISKTNLSLWRLSHALALAYLAARFVPSDASWLQKRPAQALVSCGKNGLDIFCLGALLSIVGFVVLLEAGREWPYQVAVNAIGSGVLICTAIFLTRRKDRRRLESSAVAPLQGSIPVEPRTSKS